MPDPNPKDSNEDPTKDSVDLSDLKSFSFGTQWTEAKKGNDASRSRGGKGGGRGGDRPNRRPGGARKDRRPPRPDRSQFQGKDGGPSQGGAPGGYDDRGSRPRRRGGRNEGRQAPFNPYESPVFDVCFYPEDSCFSAIIKAMRTNHLTYELFHVAKLFMEKPDRFIASITRKAEGGAKPEKVFICAIDNMAFATEEEVFAHAIANHSENFFTIEEVEVEPPSGNFPFVSRCPFTKELLGPPNYHKYEANLRNHHRTRLPNMSFEKLQASIETVREEEVVNQWLESQKKAIRYTTKAAEGEETKSFDSIEGATGYLRTEQGQKVVKQVNYARVHGTVLEKFQDSEAFKAMDGERQRQLRFPLDTANAIRGRMRREKFSIYKKGAKGVTYVCSTKRNFRTPGQVMSPDLDNIIHFLEANQLIKAKEMAEKYAAWLKEKGVEKPFDEKKMQRDLHWLVADGYVSHFEDDTLFAQPELDAGSQGSSEQGSSPKKSAKPTPPAASAASESSAAKPEPEPAAEIKEEAPTPEPEAAATEATAQTEEPESEAPKEAESSEEAEKAPEAVTAATPTEEPSAAEPVEEPKKESAEVESVETTNGEAKSEEPEKS